MKRIVLALPLVMAATLPAQDKASRIKDIETEIASLEKRLQFLRKELRALRPIKKTHVANLRIPLLEVGQVGPLWPKNQVAIDFKVLRVLNEREAIVRPEDRLEYLVIRMDTTGLADGRRIDLSGTWEVVGVKRIGSGGNSYYIIEKVD